MDAHEAMELFGQLGVKFSLTAIQYRSKWEDRTQAWTDCEGYCESMQRTSQKWVTLSCFSASASYVSRVGTAEVIDEEEENVKANRNLNILKD